MMIGLKQLLVIVLVIAGIWLFRRLRARVGPRREANPPSYRETVRCTRCGTHIPRPQAEVAPEGGWRCGDRNCIERYGSRRSSG